LKIPFAPFAPAGSILEQLIEHAIYPRSYCITNSVACTPYDDGNTIRVPKNAEVETCSTRLQELILISKPMVVIAAGKVAAKALSYIGIDYIEIMHPALIARQGEKGTVDLNRSILQIREGISAKEKE
jgi:uracil-DNA glycosylase